MWIGIEMPELIEQFIPLFWFIGIALFGYFLFHKFVDVMASRAKQIHRPMSTQREANIDNQFDSLVSNAPKLLLAVRKEIEDEKERGVTDDQMKGLKQKEGMLSFLSDNHELIEMVGKPTIKKVLGVINRI